MRLLRIDGHFHHPCRDPPTDSADTAVARRGRRIESAGSRRPPQVGLAQSVWPGGDVSVRRTILAEPRAPFTSRASGALTRKIY